MELSSSWKKCGQKEILNHCDERTYTDGNDQNIQYKSTVELNDYV